MEFQIGELSEEHQKYNKNTHIQTHTQNTTRTHTHKAEITPSCTRCLKKMHMSHKYLLALKGVLIFCQVINALHNVIA